MRSTKGLRPVFCKSGGERGVVLVTALLVMLILLPLGAVFLSVSMTETTIASNEVTAAQAFSLADAGIEHAKRALLNVTPSGVLDGTMAIFPGGDTVYLPGWDTCKGKGCTPTAGLPKPALNRVIVLRLGPGVAWAQPPGPPPGPPPPGPTVTQGSYTVQVTNNIAPDFPRGLIIPADPSGSPTIEKDGILVVTSTGTYQNASRSVEMVVRVASFDAPGAVYLPGTAADSETKFTGTFFTVDGKDYKLGGTPAPGPAVPGIATNDAGLTTEITDLDPTNGGLSPAQFGNVLGNKPAPSVETSNAVYDSKVNIANFLKYPHTTLTNGLIGNATWGTDAAPQITYIDAATTEISGNVTGSGVLIVNSTVKIMAGSSFNFHGLVIVQDEISTQAGATVDILGSLWLARSEPLSPLKPVELDLAGDPILRYSSEALALVNDIWGVTIMGWREVM